MSRFHATREHDDFRSYLKHGAVVILSPQRQIDAKILEADLGIQKNAMQKSNAEPIGNKLPFKNLVLISLNLPFFCDMQYLRILPGLHPFSLVLPSWPPLARICNTKTCLPHSKYIFFRRGYRWYSTRHRRSPVLSSARRALTVSTAQGRIWRAIPSVSSPLALKKMYGIQIMIVLRLIHVS